MENNEMLIITDIMNEDGTTFGSDFPENPLKEKWDKLYPPTRYGEPCAPYYVLDNGDRISNYGCILCHEMCPHSNNWEVPEEDKEIWEEYQRQIMKYHKTHNPSFAKSVEDYLKDIEVNYD